MRGSVPHDVVHGGEGAACGGETADDVRVLHGESDGAGLLLREGAVEDATDVAFLVHGEDVVQGASGDAKISILPARLASDSSARRVALYLSIGKRCPSGSFTSAQSAWYTRSGVTEEADEETEDSCCASSRPLVEAVADERARARTSRRAQ